MKTALCTVLLSAGLFSAQMTLAQAPAPVSATPTAPNKFGCATLNVACMTKTLSLSADQVTRVTNIQKQYEAQCGALAKAKPTATSTQEMADFLKKRDAEIKAVLDPEQRGKLDSALRTCATPAPPATSAPAR